MSDPEGYAGAGVTVTAAAGGEAVSEAPEAAQVLPSLPVPVTHTRSEPVASMGADYGGWMTYAPAATAAAFIIAPHDEMRSRILIVVQVTSGTIWIGAKAQVQASPPLGGNLPAGVYELKHKQEIWMIPDGSHAPTVSVLIERYDGTR